MNHGLNWEKEQADQQDTDHLAGATPDNIASIPWRDRDLYIPKFEIQKAKEDSQACASFSPSAGWKAMVQYLWDRDLLTPANKAFFRQFLRNGRIDVSELFPAILSGTTESGNSLKAPLQAIREYGMIPGHLLPLEPWMTWKEAHDPQRITQAMRDLGKECAQRLVFNYERVFESQYAKWLEDSLIAVGGYAWNAPDEQGIYQRVNAPHNHAFLLWNLPPYEAFDSYPDTFDGDAVKQLAPNYDLTDYGYRLLFSKQGTGKEAEYVNNALSRLWQLGFYDLFISLWQAFNRSLQGIWKH